MDEQEDNFTKIQGDPYMTCLTLYHLFTNTATLSTAKAAYNAVKTAGGTFNQGGYPPLAVKIASNNLVVMTRYDNRKYNDKFDAT